MENTSEPTTLSVHSRAMFKAAIVLSHQYNIAVRGQFIGWQIAQTGGNRINALSSMCQGISEADIVGIVGPTFSREAHTIATFGERIGIPVISYSATDPDLSDRNAYPTFYRTVPSDNAAAMAIAKLFIRYNWTSSIIIYQNDAFGSGGAKRINQAFNNIDVIVRQMIVFDIATLTIRGDLKTLLTSSSTRIIILWADPINTPLILQSALDSDVLGPQFTWVLSSSISLNSFNQTMYHKLVGMITVEPVIGSIVDAPINTTLLNAAHSIWQEYEPETFPGEGKVDYYALFAFDATWSLIQSLEKLCSIKSNNSFSCTSMINSSYCFDRRFMNSISYFDVINSVAFLGVSGPIQFSTNVTDRINGTYYVVQNSQLFSSDVNFVPVLSYSGSGDWKEYKTMNTMVWPGNSSFSPSDRAILEGVILRIAVMESDPFTIITYVIDEFGQNTTKFTGYVPDLINLLQKKMKFIPQLILAPSNKTYTEIIQDVANGVYDMMIGDVTITAARREIVSFSNSIFDNSLRIIMRRARSERVDLFSYLKPLSRNLWIILLSACIYAGVLICLLERQENEVLKNRSIISLLAMGMWFSIGVIIGYGVDFHVRTAAGRLLTVGLYIISIVFVATYTANLASYLTISKSKDTVSGIDDIKNGKLSFNRIGIRISTSVEDYYLREISGGNRNFRPLKSLKEQYESLINGVIDATFMDMGIAEYATNNIYCNLTMIGTDFDKSSFGIVMPKQWLYVQDVDICILSLRESGELDSLRTNWFRSKTCSDIYVTSTAMGIESLSGLFLTFGIISVLSLLLFMWKKRFIIKDFLLKPTRQKRFWFKNISL